MLHLNRRIGEAVSVNHDIEVRVVEVRKKTVEPGPGFTPDATVRRDEIFGAGEAAAEAGRVPPQGAATPEREARQA